MPNARCPCVAQRRFLSRDDAELGGDEMGKNARRRAAKIVFFRDLFATGRRKVADARLPTTVPLIRIVLIIDWFRGNLGVRCGRGQHKVFVLRRL